ncbi:MAG TPA: FHA domain-containing protein, partial [Polyangiaceae bacterium]
MSSAAPHVLSPRSVIGRADDCDVCLVGHAVSRHHAQVEHSVTKTLLTDLSSTNGVFLNGVGITESPVAAGDLLRIGNWVGCFTTGEAGAHNPGQMREVGPDLWGGDAFDRALDPVRAAACSRLPLRLVGESGTGKQLLARAVHAWSGRSGPFHTLNCATSSEPRIVTELFGRRTRGARAP